VPLTSWGYPHALSLVVKQPVTHADHQASVLVSLLGGLHLANSDMIMAMAFGPSDEIIQL